MTQLLQPGDYTKDSENSRDLCRDVIAEFAQVFNDYDNNRVRDIDTIARLGDMCRHHLDLDRLIESKRNNDGYFVDTAKLQRDTETVIPFIDIVVYGGQSSSAQLCLPTGES